MTSKAADTVADVIVFLKTSEEAQCAADACSWTYTGTLPTVTEMTTEFDTTTNTW
jgi:hypothetical protein